MNKTVSSTEAAYLRQGCESGIREDGRSVRDHRLVSVELDVLPHLNGSSRVRIASAIEVLCSVKAEVVDLPAGSLSQGALEVTANLSPSCNLKLDERRLSDVGSYLSQQLQRVLTGSLESVLPSLVIIPSKFCWCLHIDLLITKLDGDPLDACSMAIYSALKCTMIPRVELVLGPSGAAEDFEVVGSPASATPFPADDVPICTTFAKIGSTLVIDASSSEHACAAAALTAAVSRKGQCCGMFKLRGGGAFTEGEVGKVFHDSQALAPSIFSAIDAHIARSGEGLGDTRQLQRRSGLVA
jgi:exosome complex component RRP42